RYAAQLGGSWATRRQAASGPSCSRSSARRQRLRTTASVRAALFDHVCRHDLEGILPRRLRFQRPIYAQGSIQRPKEGCSDQWVMCGLYAKLRMLAPERARHRQELIVILKMTHQDGERPYELASLFPQVVAEHWTQMRRYLEQATIKAIRRLASDRPDTVE